ncbi:hypothetical protein [Streptomyces mexicanus]|uniref:hypothetical protein n=1 Tax=Streptomyces mexicanus TaxID=178566 RepID=UPI003666F90B
MGLGLGIAGLLALALGVAVGHLADRHGARGIYAATLVVQALATASFVMADSFWPFVLAVRPRPTDAAGSALSGAVRRAGRPGRLPLPCRRVAVPLRWRPARRHFTGDWRCT